MRHCLPGKHHRLSSTEIQDGIELSDYWGEERPRNRSECRNGIRPCPFVGCRYHLYLDVRRHFTSETIMINYAELDGPHEMQFSCALDEAEKSPGGMTLDEIGQRMNITRERVRQIEALIFDKLCDQRQLSSRVQALVEIWDTVTDQHQQQIEAMDDHAIVTR